MSNATAFEVAKILGTALACAEHDADLRLNQYLDESDIAETIRIAMNYLRHDPTIHNPSVDLCPACIQTETESGCIHPRAPTCPGCVDAMHDYIAELESEK
jgi:hypothetical protein